MQGPGQLEYLPPRQLIQVVRLQCVKGRPGPPSSCERAPKSGLFRPVSTSPPPGSSFAVMVVRRLTAAFRISARTTSSVIRALWAMRSANWSRAAASGIRAATVSILPRNCRRFSSCAKSSPAAADRAGYSRYGRELRSLSRYASAPLPPDEGVRVLARRADDVDVEALPTSSSHDRTAAPWPAASGSKLSTTLVVNRRSSCACWGSAPCRTRRPPARPRPGTPARSRNSPRPARRSPACGWPPSSGSGRTACVPWSRWASPASSGTSAPGPDPSPVRRTR